MLPLRDENPTKTYPAVTVTLIGVNVLVFLYELALGHRVNDFLSAFGAVPYEITHRVDLPPTSGLPVQLNLFTSMFLHAGWIHLLGNMLYLWIFGNNVEDSMGHWRFLIFYILCGLVAGLGQVFINPQSKIPSVGASGAIAGVLGGYILLYPFARVLTLVPLGFFIRIIPLPAILVLGMWIVLQFFQGLASLSVRETGGVAWFAHIGGFIAGLGLIKIFSHKRQRGWY